MARAATIRMALAAALAAAVVALAPAAPADAALKAIWFGPQGEASLSDFERYRELRVDVVQEHLRWRTVASRRPVDPRDPADPAYSWPAALSSRIAQARRYGMRVSLTLHGVPAWANEGRAPEWSPTDPADFADFAAAAAKRYRSVRHWMVWVEPANHFLPMPEDSPVGPRAYALVLDKAYAALKGVRRSNIVVGGNSWSYGSVKPADFVRWMRLPNGKPPRLDWYGHNPFGFRYPKLSKRPYNKGVRDMSDVDTLHREILRTYRKIGRRPRMWLSEYTIPSGRPDRFFAFSVSRQGQARYLSAAFRIARQKGYIAGMGWFGLRDLPESPGSFKGGLMTANGKRKPAFYAYRRARG